MKLRTLLLVSCMLVVPALAMFSHLIPSDFRAAVRRGCAAATSGWFGTPAEAGVVASPPAPPIAAGQSGQTGASAPPAAAIGLNPAATPSSATAALAPVATALPPAAAGAPPASAGPLSAGTPPAAPVEPATPALVAQLADRTRQVRDQQARDQREIEAQLAAVGAMSFDCQPLPGSNGLFSSSCRVPVDATGQLQRVFQASGHDPGSASAALLEQVMAWRQRMASQSPAAASGGINGGVGPLPAERFR